jgi:CheY-like chemotaxis protein
MPEDLLERDEVLRQIGRADAITKVARGVVHNFNNFLAVMLGRVELMLGQVDSGRLDPVPLRRGLLSMQQVAKDAAELLKRLRDLTQPPPPEPPTLVDVNGTVLDAVDFLQPHLAALARTTGVTHAVTPRLTAEPVTVSGHASVLREALVSLLLNAVEAMPRGGAVTVETRRDGARVVLRVIDGGVGMTDDVLARVFTPFFTTKGATSAGLGLSTVKEAVTRHGGAVAAESRAGAGSVFTVSLPFAEAIPARVAAGAPGIPDGLEVLVVEDEPALGEVLEEFLRACGCRVTLAGDGNAAVEAFRRRRYDVVLSDLQQRRRRRGRSRARPARLASGRGHLDVRRLTQRTRRWSRGPACDAALPKPVDLARLSRVIAGPIAPRNRRDLTFRPRRGGRRFPTPPFAARVAACLRVRARPNGARVGFVRRLARPVATVLCAFALSGGAWLAQAQTAAAPHVDYRGTGVVQAIPSAALGSAPHAPVIVIFHDPGPGPDGRGHVDAVHRRLHGPVPRAPSPATTSRSGCRRPPTPLLVVTIERAK